MTEHPRLVKSIKVTVVPRYEKDRSQPEQGLYVFSYTVTIQNNSSEVIQINRRSWTITDALLHVEHIEGEGVVGEQPIIASGENYCYTSFCPLKTNFGSMKGCYFAITANGETIKIDIPEFILAHPFAIQ